MAKRYKVIRKQTGEVVKSGICRDAARRMAMWLMVDTGEKYIVREE